MNAACHLTRREGHMAKSNARPMVGSQPDGAALAAIESAIGELSAIEHRAGWERVEKIVEIISKYFFAGEIGELHQPSSQRAGSIRTLASHPSCPLSKSQLHGVLAAHRVYYNDPSVRCSAFLTPSHVATAALLDAQDRADLLKIAEERRLSVRDLASMVRDLRRRSGEKRGRPPTTSGEKAITRYENGVLCLQEGNELLEPLGLPPDVRLRLFHVLEQARSEVERALELVGAADGRPLVSSYPSRIAPAFADSSRKRAS